MIQENENLISISGTHCKTRERIIETGEQMFIDRGYTNIKRFDDDQEAEIQEFTVDRCTLPKKHAINSIFEHLMSAYDEKRNEKVQLYFTTLQRAGLVEIKDFRDRVIVKNVTHCILVSQDAISNSALKNLKSNCTIDYSIRKGVNEVNEYLNRRDYAKEQKSEFFEEILAIKIEEEGTQSLSQTSLSKIVRSQPTKKWLEDLNNLKFNLGKVSYRLHQSSEKRKLRLCLVGTFTFSTRLGRLSKSKRQEKFCPYLRRLKTEIEKFNIIVDKNPIDSVIFALDENDVTASEFLEYSFITTCPSIHFETFTYDEMTWPVARAMCQPSFELLSDSDYKKYSNLLGFQKNEQLHKKFIGDRISRYYDWSLGSNVKSIRRLGTLDPFLSFSVVCEPKYY